MAVIALFALLSFSPKKQASRSNQKAATHALSTITLSFINDTGTGGTVYLNNNYETGQDYIMYSVNGSNAYLYNLPEGTYSFYYNPTFPNEWNYYTVGCNPEFETRGEVWINEVTFDSNCNTIYAN